MANDVVVKDAPKQDAATQGSALGVILYTPAGAVLNDLPVTLVEKITVMAKKKFSDLILAGHGTDKDMCQFRTDYLYGLIDSQHEQFTKQVKARDEQRCRERYVSLRERGISVADASKASGYNPLT